MQISQIPNQIVDNFLIFKCEPYSLLLVAHMDFTIRKAKKEDCTQILNLIQELAVYEKAEDQVEISVQDLERDGFGENQFYKSFVAQIKNEIIGVAIYYEKYSTWKGRCIYLEDLIVTENKRGLGAGKALFESVMIEAKKGNYGRMEWQVLDWNDPAIKFYESYSADLDNTWINGRFQREGLKNFKK